MMDNYEKLGPGHLFQKELTGEMKKYDDRYMEYYTKMDDSMSRLRYNLLTSYVEFDSICDFGYGDGAFLKYCANKKHKTFGHDVSGFKLPDNITIVDSVYDVDVDVVTFYDAIEHIPDRNLHILLSNLNTKYIVISLPWYHEYMGTDWFMSWKHRKDNEHFHYFDAHGLVELIHRGGYVPIHLSNAEDSIRKSVSYLPNILTIIAKKS